MLQTGDRFVQICSSKRSQVRSNAGLSFDERIEIASKAPVTVSQALPLDLNALEC